MEENKLEVCDKCGKNPKNEPDTCPYEKEFWDGIKELDECNCCDECRKECGYNI